MKLFAVTAVTSAALALPGAAAATPSISSFSPTSGPAGTVVTIQGSFQSPTAVRFAGVAASFNALSSSKILAVVPASALSGPITVTTPGGTAATRTSFQVTRGLVPSVRSAPPGGKLRLSGSGFSRDTSFTIQLDNTHVATGVTNAVGGFSGLGVTVPLDTTLDIHSLTLVMAGISFPIRFLVQADWPMVGFGSNGVGTNGWENTLTPGNVGALTQKWAFKAASEVVSAPAVVGGVAYFGSLDGHVYAVDTSTHKQLWAVKPAGHEVDFPAVSGGTVFVGDDFNLYALSAATGKTLWSHGTLGDVYTDPVVDGGVVYFSGWNGSGSAVWALDATNGGQLWTKQLTTQQLIGSPSVSSTRVFIGDAGGKLYALGRSTGAIAWTRALGGQIGGHPAVAGQSVWVDSNGVIYEYTQSTGTKQWSTEVYANQGSPAYDSGKIFAVTIGGLTALDANTGATLWTYPLSGVLDFTSAVVADGVVYATMSSRVYAVRETTGSFLWSTPASYGNGTSTPIVADGRLYFGSPDDYLHVFGL